MIIIPLGFEQPFTVANTFGANSTVGGATLVRVVNTGNTSAVITVTNSVTTNAFSDDTAAYTSANLTVLPLTEVYVKKASNNSLTASNTALLGTPVAFSY